MITEGGKYDRPYLRLSASICGWSLSREFASIRG
jgi:hypothetical protein